MCYSMRYKTALYTQYFQIKNFINHKFGLYTNLIKEKGKIYENNTDNGWS